MKKIYLAIPYTHMKESAYIQANELAAWIMKEYKYLVFSPITHYHPLESYDVWGSWEYWEQYLKEWIRFCDEVWVIIPSEGENILQESTWVKAEIEIARNYKKKIQYIDFKSRKIQSVLS